MISIIWLISHLCRLRPSFHYALVAVDNFRTWRGIWFAFFRVNYVKICPFERQKASLSETTLHERVLFLRNPKKFIIFELLNFQRRPWHTIFRVLRLSLGLNFLHVIHVFTHEGTLLMMSEWESTTAWSILMTASRGFIIFCLRNEWVRLIWPFGSFFMVLVILKFLWKVEIAPIVEIPLSWLLHSVP